MPALPDSKPNGNKLDTATLGWLSINDPRRRRSVWHQRVILIDRELTLTAVRLAGLVLASYEIGVGKPVKLPLRGTAEALGVNKRSLIRARDLLVERKWLVRTNDGSTRTAAYDLGPGPAKVTAVSPSKVTAMTPPSNKTSTRLSESERSEAQKKSLPIEKIKSPQQRKLPLMAVVGGER